MKYAGFSSFWSAYDPPKSTCRRAAEMKRHKKHRKITPLHLIVFLALVTVLAPYLISLIFVLIFRVMEIANDIEYYILVFRTFALIGAAITVFLLIWFFFLPILLFAFRRIRCYISIFAVCRKNKFNIRLKRFPFASLIGIRPLGDIEIKATYDTYSVHFIDIVFRAHRGFTLISDEEYSISTRRAQLGLWGGGFVRRGFNFPLTTAYSSMETASTVYTFPTFDSQNSKHIIIVNPTPNHCVYVDRTAGENGTRAIYNGYSIGNVTYYSIHGFLKFLKRI